MKKLSILSLAVLLMVMLSINVSAVKNETKFRLSVNGGYHLITDSDVSDVYDSNLAFGANFGYLVTPEIEFTAGVSLFSTEDTLLGLFELSESFFLLGGYFHLGPGQAVDPKIGGGLTIGSVDILFADDSGIGAWASAGLDFMMSNNLFFGVEARYLLFSIDGEDWGGLQILVIVGINL